MPRFTMRTLVLVLSLCTAMIGTPQARPPICSFSSQQIADTFVAVRHQVWAECDCLHAESNRVFRRCYRAGVRRLGTERGLPEGCLRELVAPEAVRSTCGRPKAVCCCTSRRHFKGTQYTLDRCAVKPSAKQCIAPRSGKACVNFGQQSCLDGIGANSNCGCMEE